ncbi:MAG: xylulose kinase [Desulfobacteraceae bacterium]|nr:xylulose kinase [Desulfobacteraceae bacterium]MBC2754647.1 xylulose kinase [Desulfobacteraceae bacterium]
MPKNKEKYILAIDLGTSGPKSALVTTRGEVIDSAFVENTLHLLPDGGAEQDPEQWWESILETFKIILNKKLVPSEDIIAISCSTQWSGTVAVDKNGNHLSNALIWLDSRGSQYVREISDGILKVEGYGISKIQRWLRLTGGAPSLSGKDSIAHILYIKNQRPDIYHKTYKFLEPKDYINLRLTGKFAASFDSITLHWVTDNRNINNITYDDRLIRMSTIEKEKLPGLKQAIDILGPLKPEVADELGLRPDVEVIMGTPDVQAAAIGSGGVSDYDAHFYIGTSSWLTCHVPFKKTDIFRGIASLPSAIPGRYFVANEQETAGACLTFLRDNIFFHKDDLLVGKCPSNVYQIFDTMADKIPAGSGGVIFTPWLYGERTPLDDKYVRGGFFNQSLETTREHMVRAVLEGVAYNGRWLLESVEKFVKRRLDRVRMIGGGAASDVWCQMHADVFNREILQIKQPILANVRGAAFLASVAMGYMNFDDLADVVEVGNVYYPNPDRIGIYDRMFKEFKNIYKKNRKIYTRLNRV